MATSSYIVLSNALEDLRDAGVAKKGMVWCKRSEHTIFSFELQRSKYDERYFVNIGVWFLSLGERRHVAPHRCHFYGRFGGAKVEAALDFTVTVCDREAALRDFKQNELLPAAAMCRTTEGAIYLLSSGKLRVPLVRPEARAILGLSR